MNTIQLKINNYSVTPTRVEVGTEKSYGFEKLSFSFSSEWSGLFKTVTFYPKRRQPVSIEGIEGGVEYALPAEVTERAGYVLYVVSGYADGKRIYTVEGALDVLSSNDELGVAPNAPTPSEIEQIRQYALEAKEAAEEAARAAASGGGGSYVSVNANFNQTDPDKPDYIVGRENIATKEDLKNVGGGGESIFIGYTHFTNQYGIPESGELDVASYITYKPAFNEAYDGCGMPSAIKDGFVDSSGYYQGYTFHSFRFEWNYQSAGFSIYFHTFLDNGERKVIRLHYQYADSEAAAPQSITAYLTTDNPIGDIETALDNIIAIQESLIGGDSV